MKKSDSITKLAEAFVKCQADMPGVEFDAKNPFLKNKYASLGAVIKVSAPVLAKHGLAVIQIPVSSEGETERIGPPENKDGEAVGAPVTSRRKGIEAIGLETILLHTSGEWLSDTLFIPLSKEKGKSNAQMAGSIISYLRRYARAAALGMYADEDIDGNDPQGGPRGDDSGGFDSAAPSRQVTQASARQPEAKPATAAASPAPASTTVDPPAIAELRKKMGPNAKAFVWFLRHYDSGNGTPVLPPPKGFAEIPLDWAKHFIDSFDEIVAKCDAFLAQNPMPEPEAAGTPKPVEVPRDPQPATPDAWRDFLMPFGEQKGTPLAKLDPKYAFGLWANYKVQTEYKGKPNSPERIAADTLFRKMLDDLGAHRGHKA